MKNIIDFFGCQDKKHWLDEIRKSDWRAASFLVHLINENKIEKTLGKDTKLYILTDNDKAVAFVTLSEKDCLDAPDLSPWIGFVYTFPQYRGNRYMGLLIDEAIKIAKKNGNKNIYISTNEIGLYEKYGFTYMESRIDIYGEEARIYLKNLKV